MNDSIYRFSPRRVREAGLNSKVEAQVLLFLADAPKAYKEVLRAFDARLLEKLERRGLLERDDGYLRISAEGLRRLNICTREERP